MGCDKPEVDFAETLSQDDCTLPDNETWLHNYKETWQVNSQLQSL